MSNVPAGPTLEPPAPPALFIDIGFITRVSIGFVTTCSIIGHFFSYFESSESVKEVFILGASSLSELFAISYFMYEFVLNGQKEKQYYDIIKSLKDDDIRHETDLRLVTSYLEELINVNSVRETRISNDVDNTLTSAIVEINSILNGLRGNQ